MAKRRGKNNIDRSGYAPISDATEKRQAKRALARARREMAKEGLSDIEIDEAITASDDLSDLATEAGKKIGNKTGPRKQGLDKKGKRLKAYFGEKFIPREKREGPNVDGKARKANRTKRIHARGTDVVEALMHVQAERKGELTQEWKFRSECGPRKMQFKTEENLRKLTRYFNKHTDLPELPQTAVSNTAESVVLEHAWKKSGGRPVTVSIVCMDSKNKGSEGPGRLLNQQECQGIQARTGYDPNELVDDYLYGFDDDDQDQGYAIPDHG